MVPGSPYKDKDTMIAIHEDERKAFFTMERTHRNAKLHSTNSLLKNGNSLSFHLGQVYRGTHGVQHGLCLQHHQGVRFVQMLQDHHQVPVLLCLLRVLRSPWGPVCGGEGVDFYQIAIIICVETLYQAILDTTYRSSFGSLESLRPRWSLLSLWSSITHISLLSS